MTAVLNIYLHSELPLRCRFGSYRQDIAGFEYVFTNDFLDAQGLPGAYRDREPWCPLRQFLVLVDW